MKVRVRETMSVYQYGGNRVNAPIDPPNASTLNGLAVFKLILTKLQQKGVRPGTPLIITIETMKKKSRKKKN